jgi:hypothetical protein
MKEEHLVFIRGKSWPLIQIERISTISQKSSSQATKFGCKRLIMLALLGQCRGVYKGDQTKIVMLWYSTVSGHQSGVLFVLFGEEMRH